MKGLSPLGWKAETSDHSEASLLQAGAQGYPVTRCRANGVSTGRAISGQPGESCGMAPRLHFTVLTPTAHRRANQGDIIASASTSEQSRWRKKGLRTEERLMWFGVGSWDWDRRHVHGELRWKEIKLTGPNPENDLEA